MDTNPQKHLNRNNLQLAYRLKAGNPQKPTLVFLPGYRSDMNGSKALFLEDWAQKHDISYLRLDYSGHGESEGLFEDGTIGIWTDDALEIIDTVTTGPLVVIGSSMGGWIGLLVSTKRPERVTTFLGIAAAPDFTKWVWEQELSDEQRERCERDGKLVENSPYSDEPDVMTFALFEDGKNHLLLEGKIPFKNPVILLHGKQDKEVPWKIAEHIKENLNEGECEIIYINDGEHRLSRDQDLKILEDQINKIYSL